jgi:5S rRNA maturation endonuclease (ribonuclease M5)
MPLTSGFIIRQLNRLPRESGLRIEPHYAWLRCCFHGRGRERTPSLRINLDRSTEYRIGSFICFGCNNHGGFNDIAKALKLKQYKAAGDDEIDLEISEQTRQNILGESATRDTIRADIAFAPPWPKKQRWRTIPGWLLARLDARLINTKYGERLYLPVKIHGEIAGGVTCTLYKARRSYIYDKGRWIRESLFPFDYVKRLLRKQRRRIIFLVEGPRDALRLLSFGIPALSILGGKTVWRKIKAVLLMELDPRVIVLAFDPDKIGQQITALVREDLHGQVKLQQLKFTIEKINGKTVKNDPGSIPEWRALRIKQRLGI